MGQSFHVRASARGSAGVTQLLASGAYRGHMSRVAFIEPCLPSPADRPPSGSNWIHEIKHDGFRLMARRDPVGIRLITRRGNDWTQRYPLVVEAVNHLKVRSCLIDGEVVCCDEQEMTSFQLCANNGMNRRRFYMLSTYWS